ncbi:MAG: mechanosensitive ion channel [Alphaproteobacteria bacterium]|nr:mechanosensitive ion channel [Alphaproteobacteria bacterium]
MDRKNNPFSRAFRKLGLLLFKPSHGVAKWLIFALVLLLASLAYTGHLEMVQAYLDKPPFAFAVGDYKFTAFMVVNSLLSVVVLFWITSILAGFGNNRIGHMRHLRPSTRILFSKLFQIILYTLAIVMALDVIGVKLTTLTVFGGALGIGLGFGLQKITSNFISGMILLVEKSIELDNLVELADGTTGYVRKTQARFTLLETFDGKEVLIPNEDFIINRVTNLTYSNKRGRVDTLIRVAYGSDLEKARDLILEAANEHPRCIQDPPPSCFLSQFNESSVDFLLYFWVADVTEGRLAPKSEVHFSIWRKFQENNIKIPFPQREFLMRKEEKAAEAQVSAQDSGASLV